MKKMSLTFCLAIATLFGSVGGGFAGSDLPACPSSGYGHNCFGTYTWESGSKYVGEWKDDKQHGQGTYTSADGEVTDGFFEEGLFRFGFSGFTELPEKSKNNLVEIYDGGLELYNFETNVKAVCGISRSSREVSQQMEKLALQIVDTVEVTGVSKKQMKLVMEDAKSLSYETLAKLQKNPLSVLMGWGKGALNERNEANWTRFQKSTAGNLAMVLAKKTGSNLRPVCATISETTDMMMKEMSHIISTSQLEQ